jgi:hypothetical protein
MLNNSFDDVAFWVKYHLVIHIYHDVVTDSEIRELKEKAKSHVSMRSINLIYDLFYTIVQLPGFVRVCPSRSGLLSG